MKPYTEKEMKRLNLMSAGALGLIIIMLILLFNTYSNSYGVYSKEINAIAIFPKNNGVLEFDQLSYTFGHEIGHYYYFKMLSDEERNEYNNIFESSPFFVSEYSKINNYENFAEEFANRVRCEFIPGDYRGSPDRNIIFQKIKDKYIWGYNYE